jgi:tRNA threonylcarbamoyladenosine biosynthesis protein TsaE
MRRHLADAAATAVLAAEFRAQLAPNSAGWIVLLEGELGSGKSTFARALLRALGHEGPVPSPTYTLVEPYRVADIVVYHIDLYRVTDEAELRYLGWDELDDGLRLVEWPDRAPQLAAQADLRIRLDYAASGRDVEIQALTGRGRRLVAAMAAASA